MKQIDSAGQDPQTYASAVQRALRNDGLDDQLDSHLPRSSRGNTLVEASSWPTNQYQGQS